MISWMKSVTRKCYIKILSFVMDRVRCSVLACKSRNRCLFRRHRHTEVWEELSMKVGIAQYISSNFQPRALWDPLKIVARVVAVLDIQQACRLCQSWAGRFGPDLVKSGAFTSQLWFTVNVQLVQLVVLTLNSLLWEDVRFAKIRRSCYDCCSST